MLESDDDNKNKNDKMIQDTARDYAAYVKLNLPSQASIKTNLQNKNISISIWL